MKSIFYSSEYDRRRLLDLWQRAAASQKACGFFKNAESLSLTQRRDPELKRLLALGEIALCCRIKSIQRRAPAYAVFLLDQGGEAAGRLEFKSTADFMNREHWQERVFEATAKCFYPWDPAEWAWVLTILGDMIADPDDQIR